MLLCKGGKIKVSRELVGMTGTHRGFELEELVDVGFGLHWRGNIGI